MEQVDRISCSLYSSTSVDYSLDTSSTFVGPDLAAFGAVVNTWRRLSETLEKSFLNTTDVAREVKVLGEDCYGCQRQCNALLKKRVTPAYFKHSSLKEENSQSGKSKLRFLERHCEVWRSPPQLSLLEPFLGKGLYTLYSSVDLGKPVVQSMLIDQTKEHSDRQYSAFTEEEVKSKRNSHQPRGPTSAFYPSDFVSAVPPLPKVPVAEILQEQLRSEGSGNLKSNGSTPRNLHRRTAPIEGDPHYAQQLAGVDLNLEPTHTCTSNSHPDDNPFATPVASGIEERYSGELDQHNHTNTSSVHRTSSAQRMHSRHRPLDDETAPPAYQLDGYTKAELQRDFENCTVRDWHNPLYSPVTSGTTHGSQATQPQSSVTDSQGAAPGQNAADVMESHQISVHDSPDSNSSRHSVPGLQLPLQRPSTDGAAYAGMQATRSERTTHVQQAVQSFFSPLGAAVEARSAYTTPASSRPASQQSTPRQHYSPRNTAAAAAPSMLLPHNSEPAQSSGPVPPNDHESHRRIPQHSTVPHAHSDLTEVPSRAQSAPVLQTNGMPGTPRGGLPTPLAPPLQPAGATYAGGRPPFARTQTWHGEGVQRQGSGLPRALSSINEQHNYPGSYYQQQQSHMYESVIRDAEIPRHKRNVTIDPSNDPRFFAPLSGGQPPNETRYTSIPKALYRDTSGPLGSNMAVLQQQYSDRSGPLGSAAPANMQPVPVHHPASHQHLPNHPAYAPHHHQQPVAGWCSNRPPDHQISAYWPHQNAPGVGPGPSPDSPYAEGSSTAPPRTPESGPSQLVHEQSSSQRYYAAPNHLMTTRGERLYQGDPSSAYAGPPPGSAFCGDDPREGYFNRPPPPAERYYHNWNSRDSPAKQYRPPSRPDHVSYHAYGSRPEVGSMGAPDRDASADSAGMPMSNGHQTHRQLHQQQSAFRQQGSSCDPTGHAQVGIRPPVHTSNTAASPAPSRGPPPAPPPPPQRSVAHAAKEASRQPPEAGRKPLVMQRQPLAPQAAPIVTVADLKSVKLRSVKEKSQDQEAQQDASIEKKRSSATAVHQSATSIPSTVSPGSHSVPRQPASRTAPHYNPPPLQQPMKENVATSEPAPLLYEVAAVHSAKTNPARMPVNPAASRSNLVGVRNNILAAMNKRAIGPATVAREAAILTAQAQGYQPGHGAQPHVSVVAERAQAVRAAMGGDTDDEDDWE